MPVAQTQKQRIDSPSPQVDAETYATEIIYRIPLAVTQVHLFESGESYAVCPRCQQLLDREYMRFCDSCGQKLVWKNFRNAERIKVPIFHSKDVKKQA